MKVARLPVVVLICLLLSTVRAEDAFFVVPVRDLQITQGALPPPSTQPLYQHWREARDRKPYAIVDGGEAYFSGSQGPDWSGAAGNGNLSLCVRAPEGKPVSGKIFMPKPDYSGLSGASFSIPADQAKSDARQKFYEAQLQYDQQLLDQQAPGAAWFRYRAGEASKILDKVTSAPANQRFRPVRGSEVEESYALFTGGRAVAENLQLDRAIAATKDEEATIDISSIKGLEVAAIDWKPLVKDLHPQTDPLAAIIPEDQHAILFPSFDAFVKVLDTADTQGTPVLELLEPRSEDAGTRARYQRQLGLDLSALSKLLGPAMVDSVAITGSDPYLRVGSDIAILFQTKQPDALRNLLQAKIALGADNAKREEGDADGLHYTSLTTDNRALRSYLASTDGAVIVTNSRVQLSNLARVIAGKSPALSGSSEYTYFRDRYKRGDENETALIILTDATIRRWCSARWRIADSRRTRAAAILSDLQARSADAIVNATYDAAIDSSQLPASMGKVKFTGSGVRSSIYGSLDFLTPICELDIDKVTPGEQTSYERWRDSYQQYWRWAFDPIAAKLTINDKQLAVDLTVIPLIAGSDYSTLINLTRGATLDEHAGDPHDDLWHMVMAINLKSEPMLTAENFFSEGMFKLGAKPLSWVGSSIALYADNDPFWDELAKTDAEKTQEYLEKNMYRIPAAISIENKSPLKLAAFLTALRAVISQTAPDMVEWVSLQYNGRSYVRIKPTEQTRQQQKSIENLALYYAATPKALVISLNEDVIKRALDREIASTQPATSKPSQPWLGQSVAARAQRQFIDLLQHGLHEQYVEALRHRCWSNLPILNEYKHRYPSEDPLKIHQRLWAAQLIDPAGGTYAWNDQDQTMESSIFGSPTSPKQPKRVPMVLEGFTGFGGGITFENQGLRARARLDRAK